MPFKRSRVPRLFLPSQFITSLSNGLSRWTFLTEKGAERREEFATAGEIENKKG